MFFIDRNRPVGRYLCSVVVHGFKRVLSAVSSWYYQSEIAIDGFLYEFYITKVGICRKVALGCISTVWVGVLQALFKHHLTINWHFWLDIFERK